MARPKLRTVRKPLMLSEEESARLAVMAKAARLNESAFIRLVLDLAWGIGGHAAPVPPAPPPDVTP
ncbi:MAG: hypothetical protein EKK55_05510 [Rhodocyclaceae bacterium]|nr:MAG: hypothetical protein EKK55_05510 [Rhodocyclaceae bacterium]